jgi:hypothetical protein
MHRAAKQELVKIGARPPLTLEKVYCHIAAQCRVQLSGFSKQDLMDRSSFAMGMPASANP